MNRRSRNETLLYILALVGVLFVIYILYGFLTAGVQAYIALFTGMLLLLGNLPEIVRSLQQRVLGNATMNGLIGMALIAYFLGSVALSILFYPLTIVLLIAAVPLALNRASVTRAYLNGARNVAGQARQAWRYRRRTM